MFELDPAHARLDIFESKMTQDIWRNKYRWQNEQHPFDTFARVASAIFPAEEGNHGFKALKAMEAGLWLPGGRIFAGAGTSKRVTLMNCYVNATIDDSMEGIMHALSNTAFTLQQGGGIGTDFSTLRPEGALLTRTHTKASGPIPFMHTWDATSRTIRSAGDRRGAMMGTICDTHPDLLSFIKAKQTKGALEQFNISILVSDALMEAVKDDAEWLLYFPVSPIQRDSALEQYDFVDEDEIRQYVYKVMRARELWEEITRATYDYSEPGVIFVDRINEANNLWYCEDIRCTNPCVTGDTLILTDRGHLPIVDLIGKEVNVWNGKRFVPVTPFETGINPILAITFSNGAVVKCTPYHAWKLWNGKTKEAKDLFVGDELVTKFEFPVVYTSEDNDPDYDAYSLGFWEGDGSINTNASNFYKQGNAVKLRLVGKFWEGDNHCKWVHGWSRESKGFVPVNASVQFCVDWLAGLLDADGNIARASKKAMPVVQLTSKNRAFLDDVRIMLSRLGVQSRFWERKDSGAKYGSNDKLYQCKSTACLMINATSMHRLSLLGLKTERLDLSWVRSPHGRASVGIKVTAIQALPNEHTYCFTEPEEHMGVFNGVPGRQCGEQPLPPHGTCNLGHVNLARVVKKPFTEDAYIDFELIKETVKIGTRFLDSVIDVTTYPLDEQAVEEHTKRRLGLGFTGLADMLAQLRVRYGSREAIKLTEDVTRMICWTAYETSVTLAKEKGAFSAYQPEYLTGHNFAATMLPDFIAEGIKTHGIRNSLLLTVAPTGTGSIFYGNVSSGGEPVFLHSTQRRVLKPSNGFKDEWETYVEWGYGARLYHSIFGENAALPPYMVTTEDLTVEEHVTMQAAAQRWIDASMSKTINVPKEYPYEQFAKVYELAYSLGCKGCTTYRPSDVRGSVLSKPGESNTSTLNETSSELRLPQRPDVLRGTTYKIKWPSLQSAMYLTINEDVSGLPFELFISSKDSRYHDWTTALTTMISSIFRKGGDISFVAQELQQVQSLNDSAFKEGKHHPSLVAYIGYKLEQHLSGTTSTTTNVSTTTSSVIGDKCPQCQQLTLIRKEGCKTCQTCGYSSCG